ncbi:unnamed protein product [Absidia cylindrospora]
MNEEHDIIVLGTGLTECILSGILANEKKRVLHMDRNDYYGGEMASLHLSQFCSQIRPGASVSDDLGRDCDYPVDLIPKFMMATGEIVKLLLHTGVTRYLDFKQIAGSFLYKDKRISHMPANEAEAFAFPYWVWWKNVD